MVGITSEDDNINMEVGELDESLINDDWDIDDGNEGGEENESLVDDDTNIDDRRWKEWILQRWWQGYMTETKGNKIQSTDKDNMNMNNKWREKK